MGKGVDSTTGLTFEQWMVVILMLFFSCAFLYSHGSSDMDRFWLAWMGIMARYEDFRQGFAVVNADYPPLSLFILHVIQLVSVKVGLEAFVVLKTVLLFFLLATTIVFYQLTRDFAATLLWHWMMLLSAMMLSYLDIFYAPFLLLSLWALKKEQFFSAVVWFCVCCTMKYQPAIIGPFYAVYLWKAWKQGRGVKLFGVQAVWVPVAVYVVVSLVWVQRDFIISFYNGLLHSRLSFQGLNGYWAYEQLQVLLTGEAPVMSPVILYGSRLAFALIYLALLWRFLTMRSLEFSTFLLFALTGFYSYFVVISGVHENHLFVAVVVAMALYMCAEKYRALALFVFLVNAFNLLAFNGLNGSGLGFKPVFLIDMTIPIAMLNTVFYGGLLAAMMGFIAKPDYFSDR